MIIPIIMMSIEVNILVVILSERKREDNTGTNIYPNASKIGMSFKKTPFRRANMLKSIEQKNIP